MEQSELSNLDLQVLDIITNFEPLPKFQLSGFWASKDKQLTDDGINSVLNKLEMFNLIQVTKDQYGREVLSINLNLFAFPRKPQQQPQQLQMKECLSD